ncbi:hypothetical protein V2G26_001747 [Clonostachys chloroleuca]
MASASISTVGTLQSPCAQLSKPLEHSAFLLQIALPLFTHRLQSPTLKRRCNYLAHVPSITYQPGNTS